MSKETKKNAQEVKEFFRKVEYLSGEYTTIPDPDLQKKIQRVREGASEVVKHIQERTEPKNK